MLSEVHCGFRRTVTINFWQLFTDGICVVCHQDLHYGSVGWIPKYPRMWLKVIEWHEGSLRLTIYHQSIECYFDGTLCCRLMG